MNVSGDGRPDKERKVPEEGGEERLFTPLLRPSCVRAREGKR